MIARLVLYPLGLGYLTYWIARILRSRILVRAVAIEESTLPAAAPGPDTSFPGALPDRDALTWTAVDDYYLARYLAQTGGT